MGHRGAFPDLRVRIRQIVAQDDMVAVHLVGSGTHRGVFTGCPPTGRSWEATCTAIYHVDDGRITRAWVNWDLVAVMEQIGCIERAATASA
ncbi:MAG: ester cyclase [Jiangellaceae bacterium]